MGFLDRLEKSIFMGTEDDYSDLMRFFQDYHQILNDRTVLNFSRWKWMFLVNPNASFPCIWVFKKNDKILAHQASIPFLLKVGDSYYRSAWGVKILVAPDYQNKGIGAILTEKWTADIDIPVALGISNDAHKMYVKAGWIELGKMACFVKLLDAGYIIQKYLSVPTITQVISGIVNLCLKLRDSISSIYVDAKKVDRFDQAIDELWNQASVCYGVIAKRDSAYLNWKYADEPDIKYSMLQFSCKDRIIGYAVLTTRKEEGICVGYIIDFLAEPRYVRRIMGPVARYFRSQKVQKFYLYILCKRLETILHKIGFHHRGEWARMMMKRKNGITSFAGEPDKWFATLGDSDLIDELFDNTDER
jgi:GNAT superfamily N-acetyltransferase